MLHMYIHVLLSDYIRKFISMKLLQFLCFNSVACVNLSLLFTSPYTAPVPHPAPVMTASHPMAKQQHMEPTNDQSKPLFSAVPFIICAILVNVR